MRADPDSPHVVRNPRTNQRFVIPRDADIWKHDIRDLIPVAGDNFPIGEGRFYTKGEIWQIIIDHAWQTGEPGVVFIDRINEDNPTPHVGRIEATNPCGEQPLLPYEACNLGSINVGAFVTDPATPEARVDWDGLRETIHDCVRFLDDVIDVNRYPLPEIDQICKANRKIGLGIMGFADALFALGVPYNSTEGVQWGERFMRFLNDESHNASELLAGQRGSFENWPGSTWDTKHHRPMRNACSTTIAPTGTISIIAGCSCGIEPLFGLVFYRNVLKGQEQGKSAMVEVNPLFAELARQRNILSEGLMDRIATEGTLAVFEEVPQDMRRVFVCANDVSPEWHVRMQAAFQRHCDASISKTINFPQTASVDDVASIYNRSYDLRCKGVTVYRDRCRQEQPMARSDDRKTAAPAPAPHVNSDPAPEKPAPRSLEPVELGEVCSAVRTRQMTPFGNMHVQITVDPRSEKELEVFAQLGKGGDLANSHLEAICRIVSLWLRAGGALEHVVRQLKGIGSSLQLPTKEGKIMSLGDGLARALQKYQRAKSRIGLKRLLLGEFDWSELSDNFYSDKANKNGNGSNGHGHGNGTHLNAGQVVAGNLTSNNDLRGMDRANAEMRHGETEQPPACDSAGGRSSLEEQYKLVCPECQSKLYFVEGCKMCESCGYSAC